MRFWALWYDTYQTVYDTSRMIHVTSLHSTTYHIMSVYLASPFYSFFALHSRSLSRYK